MNKKKAFTLIELLVVVAIIALLISILLPSLSRARELSKRLVCAANLKGIGTSFKIYANDNEESWPIAPFNDQAAFINWYIFNDTGATNQYQSLQYSTAVGAVPGRRSPSVPSQGPGTPTTTLSTTRSLWVLVRSGEVTPKQFICPSSGDQVDAEANIDLYYDFADYDNISYGYQVPYGPFDSRASESSDPRLSVAADKGPYSTATPANPAGISATGSTTYNSGQPDLGLSPQDWRGWNSGNHGGSGTGEGQNVLFADGHATFNKSPLAGIDNDNIYTNMNTANNTFEWLAIGRLAVMSGAGPWFPGDNAFSTGDSSTDSVIYP